jgi:hypothetical protein
MFVVSYDMLDRYTGGKHIAVRNVYIMHPNSAPVIESVYYMSTFIHPILLTTCVDETHTIHKIPLNGFAFQWDEKNKKHNIVVDVMCANEVHVPLMKVIVEYEQECASTTPKSLCSLIQVSRVMDPCRTMPYVYEYVLKNNLHVPKYIKNVTAVMPAGSQQHVCQEITALVRERSTSMTHILHTVPAALGRLKAELFGHDRSPSYKCYTLTFGPSDQGSISMASLQETDSVLIIRVQCSESAPAPPPPVLVITYTAMWSPYI